MCEAICNHIEAGSLTRQADQRSTKGYYGAKSGRLTLQLDTAPNDVTGTWHVRVQEPASGVSNNASFRVR